MEARHREALRRNWVFLTDNLTTDELLDHMLGKSILTNDMYDEVNAEKTRKEKVTRFLFSIQRRGPEAFGQLLLGLRNTGQEFIAEKLVETLTNNNQPQPMQLP